MFNLRDNELDFPRDIPRLVYLGARAGMAFPRLVSNNARDIYSQYRASNPANPSLRGSYLNKKQMPEFVYYTPNQKKHRLDYSVGGAGAKMPRYNKKPRTRLRNNLYARAPGISSSTRMSTKKLRGAMRLAKRKLTYSSRLNMLTYA